MVTKLLLTLLVIVAAYFYLRRRVSVRKERRGPSMIQQGADSSFRVISILFLLVSFTLTAGFFTYRWYDNHQLLRVTLSSPDLAQPVVYEVYKSELEESRFTTIEGQIIRVGSQDRLLIEQISD